MAAAARVLGLFSCVLLGGTYYGQEPDAKTATTVKKKGDKARPNDGRN
jgi:hypothetical protein